MNGIGSCTSDWTEVDYGYEVWRREVPHGRSSSSAIPSSQLLTFPKTGAYVRSRTTNGRTLSGVPGAVWPASLSLVCVGAGLDILGGGGSL